MKRIVNVFQNMKSSINRLSKIPPEHIGYAKIGRCVVAEFRCPSKDCGLSVSEDWICCPYCGQRLGEFKEDKYVRYVVIKMEKEYEGIREDTGGV